MLCAGSMHCTLVCLVPLLPVLSDLGVMPLQQCHAPLDHASASAPVWFLPPALVVLTLASDPAAVLMLAPLAPVFMPLLFLC